MMAGTPDPAAATDWRARAATSTFPAAMFVGGEQRAARDGAVRPLRAARDLKTTWIRYA
jgi:hypothetical protein